MAIQAIIEEMNAQGIPATLELPNGMWCHSPEYLKRRYGGRVKAAKPAANLNKVVPVTAERLIARLNNGKLTPSERTLLLAMLEEK